MKYKVYESGIPPDSDLKSDYEFFEKRLGYVEVYFVMDNNTYYIKVGSIKFKYEENGEYKYCEK